MLLDLSLIASLCAAWLDTVVSGKMKFDALVVVEKRPHQGAQSPLNLRHWETTYHPRQCTSKNISKTYQSQLIYDPMSNTNPTSALQVLTQIIIAIEKQNRPIYFN